MTNDTKPKLSVVIPLYNEQANVAALFDRLFNTLGTLPLPWEVVCVNDGSKDETLELLLKEREGRKGMVVVDLARNFGQHSAVMAGFKISRGDWIITMDADLQNPPEEIPRLVDAFQKGHDLIGTIRQGRKDSLFRKFASRITNRLITRMSGISLMDFGCMLRGYSREVVDGILKNPEYRTFIPALATFFARNPTEIPVRHEERTGGSSKYSILKLLSLQLDLMLGFSLWPLRILFFVGTIVALLGLILGLVILALRLYFGTGWAAEGVFTLFAVLFFIVGGQFFALGLIGDYIGRIFQAIRKRPNYVLRETYRDE
ncbi:MAG: glycosyltransferase [Desulfobacteraceae bacterium]|nr:glycosyltransferase [Desulfobacteraceae bacterium]